MVTKEPYYFRSANSINMICGMKWIPSESPIAVLHICHGMAEHLVRYDAFATYMAEKGIVVIVSDLVGHGHSVSNKDELGYFGDYLVNSRLIADMFSAKTMIQKTYSHLPYFVLGHSMGSIIVRQYMMTHKENLDGVILIGTVDYPDWMCRVGKGAIKLMSLFHKEKMRYRSHLVNQLGLGGFDKAYKHEGLRNSWLSRDKEEVQAFNHDPLCNFTYTIGVYRDVLDGLLECHNKRRLAFSPKDIPIAIMSGTKDPCGNMGKTPKKIYRQYKKLGFQVGMKLYKGARHEILHETNREEVYEDIYNWMIRVVNPK